MALVGCFVTPHPPIIVPEVGGDSLAHVDATVKAMNALRERAAALHPETIVIMSPHSPLARDHMGVSLASAYKGSLAAFQAPGARVEAEGDQALAEAILEDSRTQGVPAMATASPGETVELDHGAMVPLWFLMGALEAPCRLVELGFSYRSLEEHVRFGRIVARAMFASPARVVYVASSDLSHRLLIGAPAGYDPRGAEFDEAVADTFAAGDWEALLSIDPGLVRAAGECGYRSMATLAGVVKAIEAAGGEATNHVLSYEGPFGVGYLVGEVRVAWGAGSGKEGDR